MLVYWDLVVLLNSVVDLLLLLATNRLCGYPLGFGRSAASAVIGGLYAGVCMIPGFHFLGNTLWRITVLCFMAMIAYGWNRSTVRRGILFILLSMALGGIAITFSKGGFWEILASAVTLMVLCCLGFQERAGERKYVTAEVENAGQTIRLRALYDTGNTLTDPITGRPVLIVAPEIAWELYGLTLAQLSEPIVTIEQVQISGLRLIPYRSVGQSAGMMLAVVPDNVRIDGVKSDALVGFSPNGFGDSVTHQALTGGRI